ncbi:hypothetical protein [Sphingobacterium suaedae]|uniref:Uncharacterized protein n=1 Tax=Sphingobacterium suaedae TaxID=1686402 RepID=A0ABW5KF82_9SPHI
MKYSKSSTLNHPLAQSYPECVKDINQVIFDEDDNLVVPGNSFTEVEVIDLDCVESKVAKKEKRSPNKTCDITFVVENGTDSKSLLVELRFNYKNLSNLKKDDLVGKVAGSKYLVEDDNTSVHEKNIFIFQPNLVQQAINRMQRMNPRVPTDYTAMDIETLKSEYFQ